MSDYTVVYDTRYQRWMTPLPNTEAYQIVYTYQAAQSRERRIVVGGTFMYAICILNITLGCFDNSSAFSRYFCRLFLVPVLATIPSAIRVFNKRKEIAENTVIEKITKNIDTYGWSQFERIQPIQGQLAIPIHYRAETRV